MKISKEKLILYSLTGFGITSFPFLLKKQPRKDWFLIYFMKGFISSFIAFLVVGKDWISYPKRLMPKYYKISIVFDYLLFPISCVAYNQFTMNMKAFPAIITVFLFSVPMTIIEVILERVTGLIKYKKNWSWYITFITLTSTFWFVKGATYFINKMNQPENEKGMETN